ncbi:hypothetical protein HNR23_000659 [Nocardiopsis mwathae]|uniref:Uncharacterized protein n=1 Tax=Nocardiopsis mwathae TaxID=1472723 RepID=A0A7X0D4Z4_9ACTN|nr:hypothetical protein [Nocardiopsis mwathae]MBB6170599.1 hypothetical protein [Nocardiopsis mwathae]
MSWIPQSSVALIIFSLSACGWTDPGADLDRSQAGETLEKYIAESFSTLPKEAKLEAKEDMWDTSCGDAESDNTGRVMVTKEYRVLNLHPKDKEQNIERMFEHWNKNGYSVIEDARPEELVIQVETPDSFTLAVRGDRSDELSIGALSPCFSPYDGG